MAEHPEFNQELELFKLQVLSQSKASTHFTWLALYLGLIVSYWIFLNSRNPPLDLITYTVAFVIGASTVLVLIVRQLAEYHGDIEELSDYVEEIKSHKSIQRLIDLYEKDKWFWRWWRATEGQNTTPGKKRGWKFFFRLSVGLWLTATIGWIYSYVWGIMANLGVAINAYFLSGTPLPMTLVIWSIIGFLTFPVLILVFAAYLRLAYSRYIGLREFLDGLSGLGHRSESESG